MRTAKTLGGIGALLTAALLGGTMISSVFAESPSPSPGTDAPPADGTDGGQYCELFRTKLAAELNVSESQLESAAVAAGEGTIDEAVANGDLSQDVADKLKERLSDAPDHPCFGLGSRARAFHHGFQRGFAAGDLLGAAADALDMQTAELVAQLHAGKSLTAIAEAKGVDYATVSKAIGDAAKADLDKAVAAGRITQGRADEMLDRLQAALGDGEWPPAPRLGARFGRPDAPHDRPASPAPGN